MSDPLSWLMIEPGWEVVNVEGKTIGKVDEVVGDRENDIFSGLNLATSLLGKARSVPAERVTEIREGRVALDLTEDEVDRLDDAPSQRP